MTAEPETTGPERPDRDPATGQFRAGNPGRPKGARHVALLALDAIGTANAEALVRKAVELALAGDMQAMRILVDRIWPAAKGRPVTITLPEMRAASDIVAALGAIAQAVAGGELTPEEGQTIAAIAETQRRALETQELEQRIAALEGKAGQ